MSEHAYNSWYCGEPVAEIEKATPSQPGREQPAEAPQGPFVIGIKDVLCLGPLVLKSIYYYAGIWITPQFVGSNPLLVEFLRASSPALLFGGAFARAGRLPLLLVILAPVPYTMLADPFLYWAGWRYGKRVVQYLEARDPRWRKRGDRAERLFSKYGLWAILVAEFTPVTDLLYLAAGETRINFWAFIIVDFIGTSIFCATWIAVGWWFGKGAENVAQAIAHYSWYITGGMLLLIFAAVAISLWRNNKAPME